MCIEGYANEDRITPLLNPLDCLENHTQYIIRNIDLYHSKYLS